MARLGAHLSAAGGAWRAVEAARSCGCEALQLFLRAPGRWAAAALAEADVVRFREAAVSAGVEGLCFAHAPYLLNLASDDENLRDRSVVVLVEELRRAGRLGLAGVVLHPGSGGEGDRVSAEARCRAAVSEAVERAGDSAAALLLEGQAGAGGQLGRTPSELARFVEPGLRDGRVGVCLDSAHLWGAGYDLLGDGWERVLGELAEHWQLAAPQLFHGNDTTVELGSRRDRHAPPGEGRLGRRFFSKLLSDARCGDMPIVLEIPPGDGNVLVKKALARLRRWSR
ncbi:MAG: deoxyribonuclease IV [Acidobacteriia bacterium]|nr:deoxyribonuclease IV [Terriglobia bacterium]